jgi:hypothetical protein
MTVFRVVVSCSLVEVYQHFRGVCCLHHLGDDCPDDGGSKHLWNVSKLLPDYVVQQHRRQPSSYLLLWEPEISLEYTSFPLGLTRKAHSEGTLVSSSSASARVIFPHTLFTKHHSVLVSKFFFVYRWSQFEILALKLASWQVFIIFS